MKNKVLLGIVLSLILSILSPVTSSAAAEINSNKLHKTTVIKLDNVDFEVENNNQLRLNNEEGNNFEIINTTFINNSVDENKSSFTAGYEIFIPIEEDKLNSNEYSIMSVEGHIKDEAGVRAELYVDYDISANNQQIRVNRVYGSWKPSSLYYLTDRLVGCHAGVNFYNPKRFEANPSSNNFSYTLNWGYVDRIFGDASPRAWSEATIRVSGMDGSYHRLILEFPFS